MYTHARTHAHAHTHTHTHTHTCMQFDTELKTRYECSVLGCISSHQEGNTKLSNHSLSPAFNTTHVRTQLTSSIAIWLIAYVRLGQGCSRHGYAIDAHICMHVHMQVVLLDPGGYCTTAQFRSLAHASDGDAKIL